MSEPNHLAPFLQTDVFAGFPRPVCRLGLATRGNGNLTTDDVCFALSQGVNFLNWCGYPDALSQTVARLGAQRNEILVCTQFEARTATEACQELESQLRELNTDWIDVLTFYYVEAHEEWEQIASPGGALEYCQQAKREGRIRWLGLTSHQRGLAAATARTGKLDTIMIRYNAAHRGAEQDIFPSTDPLGLPVIVYTCLRWGALLRPTSADPLGFVVPKAPFWYRFALQSPSVAVALMAPSSSAELREDLSVLQAKGPLSEDEFNILAAHGSRVRAYAGQFP